MSEIATRLKPGWNALVAELTSESPDLAFQEIISACNAPNRFYHNLAHIEHVLLTVAELRQSVSDFTALRLAAWFHDLFYEPRNSDNEERSAARAEEILTRWNTSPALRAKIATMILATRKHQAAMDDLDTQILLDADLAILSEEPSRYLAYTRAIRQEYAWVSDGDFRTGRSKVLESFLQREHIYFTALMQPREAVARFNLKTELQELRKIT